MSHDQYLKGDLSLTITDADYTKRSLYTCACKGQERCDVSLQIEACNSSVQIKPGEPLVLDLLISESVEVIYNSTGAAAPSSGQICTVAGHSLKCKPEYTQRVLLISAVELQGTTPSDSGVYIIRDTKHEEIIQTYTVTVEELDPAKTAKAMVETKYQQEKEKTKVEVQKVPAARKLVGYFRSSTTVKETNCGVILMPHSWRPEEHTMSLLMPQLKCRPGRTEEKQNTGSPPVLGEAGVHISKSLQVCCGILVHLCLLSTM
ncbi:uncharacterized protein LOC118240881 [Electrophorus electricus]|uniref:uncharacterized protein LOC118240881 n=1 Tax=Electrophorus electricus TaxID=8005 RepID=UPI0015D088A9|nr:uncharacterized protein LOC118240881 [Electrophorus electricus]